jgi:hypothetical protein
VGVAGIARDGQQARGPGVVVEQEVVVREVVAGQREVVGFRTAQQRGTAGPPADHRRGDPDRRHPGVVRDGGDEVPEADHVLREPAADDVRAPARPLREVRGGLRRPHGVLGILAGFAEQHLTGPQQRLPGAGEERGARIVGRQEPGAQRLAGPIQLTAQGRLRDAVLEPEVLVPPQRPGERVPPLHEQGGEAPRFRLAQHPADGVVPVVVAVGRHDHERVRLVVRPPDHPAGGVAGQVGVRGIAEVRRAGGETLAEALVAEPLHLGLADQRPQTA